MEDSKLSMELLLVACKLLKLVLRGLPETTVLAVELDITTRGAQDFNGKISIKKLVQFLARSCLLIA